MKKVVLMLSAAAALAACSKNEVVPATVAGDAEITWLTAPKSKAIAAGDPRTDFSHDNVFASYAYSLTEGKKWNTDYADASLYINNTLVSFKSDDDAWKSADVYYWPKSGSLTFFAWSINDANLDAYKNAVSCTQEDGIKANLDVVANKNVDFMVADMQADKSQNAETYAHNGVPTLFRHKFSYVVFNVKTVKDYSPTKTFTLNSIKFTGLDSKGTYSQLSDGTVNEKMESSEAVDQTYMQTGAQTIGYNDDEYKTVSSVDQYLYMPQVFADGAGKNVEITYTVTTKVSDTVNHMETVTRRVPVNELFEKWEMGKKYTFNLRFSLDEILWDPAVENWVEEETAGLLIEK